MRMEFQFPFPQNPMNPMNPIGPPDTSTSTRIWPYLPNSSAQPQHPFISPYEGILKLEANLSPLTHFTQTTKTRKTYEQYEELLDGLRTLKAEELQVVQANKGPGLILIHNKTLTAIYEEYLAKTRQ